MSSIIINSTHLTDTVNNSTFRILFDRPVNFDNKYIGLSSASLYFSWRNITEENNKFSYIWVDDVEYNVILPIGFYEVTDILNYFQFVMRKNGHYITDPNGFNIYFIDLKLSTTLYSIDIITYPVPAELPEGFINHGINFNGVSKNPKLKLPKGMNEILGYKENFITDDGNEIKLYNSTTSPNVNPNSSVLIVCDECQNEFSNLGVLYSISPNVAIGSLIVDKPSHFLYQKLKNGLFSSLSFRILNAKTFQPMTIIDKEINFVFHVVDKSFI